MNSRYVIATSKRIDISGVDQSALQKVSASDYFTKDKAAEKKSEEAFFKQGEKPQVCRIAYWSMEKANGVLSHTETGPLVALFQKNCKWATR